jgi:hypothetical protein
MLDPAQEQRYRDVLFELLGANKVSRCALYMMEPTGEFRLTAHFGFSARDLPPAQFGKEHPIVERVNHYRKPFYFNSSQEAESMRREMDASRTARLLAAPLYEDGRLVGIIEARDKAGGELFHPEDLRAISRVSAEILKLRRLSKGVSEPHGSLAELAGFFEAPKSPSGPVQPASVPAAPVTELSRPVLTPIRPAAARPPLTQREALLLRGFGTALLLNPAVAAVIFSLWDDEAAEFSMSVREPLAEDSVEAVVASARSVYGNLFPGRSFPAAHRFNVSHPFGPSAGSFSAESIAAIQSSAVVSEEGCALLFTLVLREEPDTALATAIKETHLLVRRAISETREAVRYREAFRGLVRRLLEPGLKKYAALVTHSLSTGKIARRFATFLHLPESTVEQITVAALLHDIGMRELAYDRLSERRPLSEAEQRLARDHPAVGAMLLSDIDFPFPIVPLVHHHHERYDGSGYPDQLRGEQIPFGARLVHIVESFDAMTNPSSYRPNISREAAVDIIASKGGTQFDPDLAVKFQEFVAQGGVDLA